MKMKREEIWEIEERRGEERKRRGEERKRKGGLSDSPCTTTHADGQSRQTNTHSDIHTS